MNKQYDHGEVLDIVNIYLNKLELNDFMLSVLRKEMIDLHKHFGVEKDVLDNCYKSLEVLEQLSIDNLNYVNDEIDDLKEKWSEND